MAKFQPFVNSADEVAKKSSFFFQETFPSRVLPFEERSFLPAMTPYHAQPNPALLPFMPSPTQNENAGISEKPDLLALFENC